jgi:micrococcal nuclease
MRPGHRLSGCFRLPLVLLASLAAVAVVGCGGNSAGGDATSDPRSGSPGGVHATIAYAVDGDTLRVRDGDGDLEYVRLIGIDTPESVKEGTSVECGAEDASRSMERLAPEGAEVTLRFDGERQDNYGRTLAHAFVAGRQLELAQLRRGWAYVYRYHGRTFDGLSDFYAATDRARAEDRGVWGRCDGDFHSARPGKQD